MNPLKPTSSNWPQESGGDSPGIGAVLLVKFVTRLPSPHTLQGGYSGDGGIGALANGMEGPPGISTGVGVGAGVGCTVGRGEIVGRGEAVGRGVGLGVKMKGGRVGRGVGCGDWLTDPRHPQTLWVYEGSPSHSEGEILPVFPSRVSSSHLM